MVKVITFAGALAYAGEHGQTTMGLGDIVDQLHHVDGLAYAGATEQAHFTAFGKWADKINHFNPGFQQFVAAGLFFKGRGFAMNGPALFFSDGSLFVNGLAQHVHDAAQSFPANGYRNGRSRFFNLQPALQAVRGTHGDGSDYAVAQLLLHFKHQFGAIDR